MTACRQNIKDFDRSEISVIVRILHGGKYAIRKLQFAHSTQAHLALVSTGAVEELTVRYTYFSCWQKVQVLDSSYVQEEQMVIVYIYNCGRFQYLCVHARVSILEFSMLYILWCCIFSLIVYLFIYLFTLISDNIY